MRTGIVERATSKDVKTRFGMKKTYSLQIDGTWYSCGFTDPRASVGEEVAFESTSGPYGEEIVKGTLVRTGGLVVAPEPRPVPTSSVGINPAPKSGPSVGVRPFPIPALHGDRAIIRQNALGHAARLVSTDPHRTVGDDAVAERVISIARKFEAYACGDIDRDMAEKMAKKATEKAAKSSVAEELGE